MGRGGRESWGRESRSDENVGGVWAFGKDGFNNITLTLIYSNNNKQSYD